MMAYPQNKKTPAELKEIQREAGQRLEEAAVELRARLADLEAYPPARPHVWEECVWPYCEGNLKALVHKVTPRRGRIYLWAWRADARGVNYTSSFGPDSDKSFSGFLPSVTVEEAKLLAVDHARRYW